MSDWVQNVFRCDLFSAKTDKFDAQHFVYFHSVFMLTWIRHSPRAFVGMFFFGRFVLVKTLSTTLSVINCDTVNNRFHPPLSFLQSPSHFPNKSESCCFRSDVIPCCLHRSRTFGEWLYNCQISQNNRSFNYILNTLFPCIFLLHLKPK